MFSVALVCNGNKAGCDPLSSSSLSLSAIHPPPSFIFNFFLFIAGELSLLSGPLEQRPAMNEGTAVWEKWTFGIFIIPAVQGCLSWVLLLHYTPAILLCFCPTDEQILFLYLIKKWYTLTPVLTFPFEYGNMGRKMLLPLKCMFHPLDTVGHMFTVL